MNVHEYTSLIHSRPANTGGFLAWRSTVSALAVAALLTGCGDGGGERDPIDAALSAAGTGEALLALPGFRVAVQGLRHEPGHAFAVGGNDPASTFDATVVHDFAGDRTRIEWKRAGFKLGESTEYSETIAGDEGYIAGAEGLFGSQPSAMLSARVAAVKKQLRWLYPHIYLRELAREPAAAAILPDQAIDGRAHFVIEVADVIAPVRLFIDRKTGAITRLATVEHDYAQGDSTIDVRYDGWQTGSGGIAFPRRATIAMNGASLHEETRVSVDLETPFSDADFMLPDEPRTVIDADDAHRGALASQWFHRWAGFGFPLDIEMTPVVPVEIGPGIHLLAGAFENSLAVGTDGGVVVLEAPWDQTLAEAMLDVIAELFPGQAVTHVINTHHHMDHVGGLRTFAARGATIVTHEANREFLDQLLSAPHTILPDALGDQPRQVPVTLVGEDGLVLADSTRPIQVLPIANDHAEGLVVAFLPEQSLLFNSDMYSPGFVPLAFPLQGAFLRQGRDLLAAIEANDLAVTTIAGGHGGVGTLADLIAQTAPQD